MAEKDLKKELGRYAPWFLLCLGAIWLVWPVESGSEEQIVRFSPTATPILAPRSLLVIRQFEESNAAVKPGQALFQVFDDQGTVDEALVVSRLEKLVEDILRANGGKQTATVNQLRTKIKYSRAILSRSKRSGVVGSTLGGEFLPGSGLFDRIHRKGSELGKVLSDKKLTGNIELEPGDYENLRVGQRLRLRDIRVSGFPTQALELTEGTLTTSRISPPQADTSRYKVGGTAKKTDQPAQAALDPSPQTDRQARVIKIQHLCLFKSRPMSASELKEAVDVLDGRPVAAPNGTVFVFKPAAGMANLYNWMDEPKGEVLLRRITFELEAPELVAVANEAARQGRGLEGSMAIIRGAMPRWKRLAR